MIVTVPRVVQSIAAALIAVILLIVTTSRIAKVFDYLAQEYHPSAKNLKTAALICLWALILEVAVRLGAYFIWNKSLQSLVLRKRTALVGQWGFIALMAITALRLFVTGDGNLSSEYRTALERYATPITFGIAALIFYLLQGKGLEAPKFGGALSFKFSTTALVIGIIAALVLSGFGFVRAAFRGIILEGSASVQQSPVPAAYRGLSEIHFQTNFVLEPGETSLPIKVSGMQSYRLGPDTVASSEAEVLRTFLQNGAETVRTNRFWHSTTHTTDFKLTIRSTSGRPLEIQVAIGKM